MSNDLFYDKRLYNLKVCSNGDCSNNVMKSGEIQDSNDIIPGNMCPYAFQAVYPYYLTLSHGGWFSWVKLGDGVIVQCSNPHDNIVMKIFQNKSTRVIKIHVIKVLGKCRKGHKEGDVFSLDNANFKFCPDLLAATLPYMPIFEDKSFPWGTDKVAEIRCPHGECQSICSLKKGKNK